MARKKDWVFLESRDKCDGRMPLLSPFLRRADDSGSEEFIVRHLFDLSAEADLQIAEAVLIMDIVTK